MQWMNSITLFLLASYLYIPSVLPVGQINNNNIHQAPASSEKIRSSRSSLDGVSFIDKLFAVNDGDWSNIESFKGYGEMGFASDWKRYYNASLEAGGRQSQKETETSSKKTKVAHPIVGGGCYAMSAKPTKSSLVKWIDITKTGQPLELETNCNTVPMDFNIKFFGITMPFENSNPNFYVAPNGIITFDGSSCSNLFPITNLGSFPDTVSFLGPVNFAIAPFWSYIHTASELENTNPRTPAGLFVRQFKDLGMIVVQWNNIRPISVYGLSFNTGIEPPVTFQVQIHRDGNIFFLYEQLNCINPLVAAQIGVKPYADAPGQVPVSTAVACHWDTYGPITPEVVLHFQPILCDTNTQPPIDFTTSTTTSSWFGRI